MGFLLAGWRFPRPGAKNIPWTSNSPIPTILWPQDPQAHQLFFYGPPMDTPPHVRWVMCRCHTQVCGSHMSPKRMNTYLVVMLMNQKDPKDS